MSRHAIIIGILIYLGITTAVLATSVGIAVSRKVPVSSESRQAYTGNMSVSGVLAAALPTPPITPRVGIGGVPEVIPSPTITPWPTWQNTSTPNPLTSQSGDSTPALTPPQHTPINGVNWESIINLPPDVISHAREIFMAGQAIGRNPHSFSKVGDSTIENPHFLARFDEGSYVLGPFEYLEPAIANFRGSFGRDSLAVAIGMHSWSANDPMWADPGLCMPNETPVQCEIRVNNPAVLFIRLGTNDVGTADSFEANIRQIVETAIAAGVIPVIGTKGDRHEGSNENNDILRRLAAEYHIPLWDYDRVAETLPARGLDVDAAHMMTFFSHDYNDPTAYSRGHAMHNLTALMMLDALWREVLGNTVP